jgi:uncharacterized protein YneF (UPF0154 family)
MHKRGQLIGDNLVTILLWIVFLIIGFGIGMYIFSKLT